jgi:hypothetical protein
LVPACLSLPASCLLWGELPPPPHALTAIMFCPSVQYQTIIDWILWNSEQK